MTSEGGEAPEIGRRRKRLLFQAQHRGFKEADLVIGRFARAHLPAMDEAGLADFEALLAHSDHVICDLVLGDAPPPPGIDAGLLARMRAFVRSGGAALR